MTDRELMQQALDAYDKHEPLAVVMEEVRARLAHCDRCGKKLGGEGDIHTCTPKTNQCGETCERAKMCATCAGVLTEFDEAVAAVDATLHHAVDHWQDRALKAEALLAQPEPEPVAYPDGDVVGPCICGSWPGGKCLKCPRIATPPQRKPLSDEELFKIWLSVPAETEDRYAFARAIENAHGIKENT